MTTVLLVCCSSISLIRLAAAATALCIQYYSVAVLLPDKQYQGVNRTLGLLSIYMSMLSNLRTVQGRVWLDVWDWLTEIGKRLFIKELQKERNFRKFRSRHSYFLQFSSTKGRAHERIIVKRTNQTAMSWGFLVKSGDTMNSTNSYFCKLILYYPWLF